MRSTSSRSPSSMPIADFLKRYPCKAAKDTHQDAPRFLFVPPPPSSFPSEFKELEGRELAGMGGKVEGGRSPKGGRSEKEGWVHGRGGMIVSGAETLAERARGWEKAAKEQLLLPSLRPRDGGEDAGRGGEKTPPPPLLPPVLLLLLLRRCCSSS